MTASSIVSCAHLMSLDKSAPVRQMANLLEARFVMTTSDRILAFDTEDEGLSAFYRMKFENVDYAPVLKDGVLFGYVNRKDLDGSIDTTCGKSSRELTELTKISPQTILENVLKLLINEPVLFVVENDDLVGIITRADVNKRAFRTLFYIVITELESLLANLVETHLPCTEYLHLAGEERAKEVLYNYWRAKAGNVETQLEQYLSFSDIFNLISRSKNRNVWQLLGYKSRRQVERLGTLVDLRNRVMHSTRLILDTETDVRRLSQEYTEICGLIERLKDI